MERKDRPSFPCNYCHKSYVTKHGLKIHEDSIHKDLKFVCELCNADFCSKCNLRRHFKRCHTPNPSLKCPNCSYSFHGNSKLKKHLKKCQEEKELAARSQEQGKEQDDGSPDIEAAWNFSNPLPENGQFWVSQCEAFCELQTSAPYLPFPPAQFHQPFVPLEPINQSTTIAQQPCRDGAQFQFLELVGKGKEQEKIEMGAGSGSNDFQSDFEFCDNLDVSGVFCWE